MPKKHGAKAADSDHIQPPTKAGKVKADDDEFIRKAGFTSRFTRRFRETSTVSHQHMLLCMCTFAGAAECVNSLVTPDISWKGYNLTGTFCNITGAWMGGLALSLCVIGPNMRTLSDAFRGGFVAAYTSFCYMVEESATLQCGRSPRSLQYYVSAVFLGPLFFDFGRRTGTMLLSLFGFVGVNDGEPAKTLLSRATKAMTAVIVLSVLFACKTGGAAAGVEVAVGVISSMLGCVAGDIVGILSAVIMDFPTSVNWGTIFGNGCALAVVAITEFIRPPFAGSGFWILWVIASKHHSSFCGTLSGYGAFSEDVAGELAKGHIETAATNVGMNVLVGVFFMALLEHASCGLPFT